MSSTPPEPLWAAEEHTLSQEAEAGLSCTLWCGTISHTVVYGHALLTNPVSPGSHPALQLYLLAVAPLRPQCKASLTHPLLLKWILCKNTARALTGDPDGSF